MWNIMGYVAANPFPEASQILLLLEEKLEVRTQQPLTSQ